MAYLHCTGASSAPAAVDAPVIGGYRCWLMSLASSSAH